MIVDLLLFSTKTVLRHMQNRGELCSKVYFLSFLQGLQMHEQSWAHRTQVGRMRESEENENI